jgi:hypothetical protein
VELDALFREVADRHADDRAFKTATRQLDDHLESVLHRAAPESSTARAVRAITELLDRARAAGAVRGDVTLADLVLLLGSVPGPDVAPERRSRYVDIVLAGLRG